MAQLKYLDKIRTQQKQKGFYVANNNGGPLDVTSWVLYRDNLDLVPNKYVGKRVYVLSDDEEYYFNGTSWIQLTNPQKVNSASVPVDSKFLVKFYKVGNRLSGDEESIDNGTDEKVIVAGRIPDTYYEWSQIPEGSYINEGDVVKVGYSYFKALRQTKTPPLAKFLTNAGEGVKGYDGGYLFSNEIDFDDYEPISTILRASLILPAKYNNRTGFNIEYPKNGYSNRFDENGVLSSTYRLYYRWYLNSFDSVPIQEGYSEYLDRKYTKEKLNLNFSEKICCAVYIEMENGTLQLVGRNSCHIVSESCYNNDHNRGLVYMSSKVSQYQRGFINSNMKSAGIDTGCIVKDYNTLNRIPKYFGKRVYVYEEDRFYTYKFRSEYVDYGKDSDSDDIRVRHFTSDFLGAWIPEVTTPVKFNNFSDIDFRIVPDASNYQGGDGSWMKEPSDDSGSGTAPDTSVDIDTPPGSYRKMKFSAFLDLKVNDSTSQPVIFTLQDLLDKNYNYNPRTIDFYDHDVRISWNVFHKTKDSGESYEHLVPGDASSLEPNRGLVLPTEKDNIKDYYGNPIVSDPSSFVFEFGVTNDVYDSEEFRVDCSIYFQGEYDKDCVVFKQFTFVLERKSYIDFNQLSATEVTPLMGTFKVYGNRVDFNDGQSSKTDASSFFALNNKIGLHYKVYYTPGTEKRNENKWAILDESFLSFTQEDTHTFHFVRKNGVALPQSVKDFGIIDNGKLPFGIYRIVPYINDLVFNLKYNQGNILDYSMFQNITSFSLETTLYGTDDVFEQEVPVGEYKGQWYNGMKVSYGDIVLMRGELFQCINPNGSTYAPLERFTDNARNVLKFNTAVGGGYALTGDVNSDYVFYKTSIKPGYFSGDNCIVSIDTSIKSWDDTVYDKPYNQGYWRDGLNIRCNDLVSMGGYLFQCVNPNGTTKAPMWRYTNNAGRYLTLKDVSNGKPIDSYILTGEFNTDDYLSAIQLKADGNPSVSLDSSTFYAGSSYKGVWKNGMHLSLGDTVLSRGYLYQCQNMNGTWNPPFKRMMTNGGEYLTYSNGDYVIWTDGNNDFNSDDYLLVDSAVITSFVPNTVPFNTIVEYHGSYFKCIDSNGTTERPFKAFTTKNGEYLQLLGGDYAISNELNDKVWKLDRVERFVVDDLSKNNPKNLVFYGHIRGSYIDLSKMVLSSTNAKRRLSYEIVNATPMTQDSYYYSSVDYKVVFVDDVNLDWEKESVRITYATASNPLYNPELIDRDCFVYHPYLSPKVLDAASYYHKKDGTYVFIAGTNKFTVNESGAPVVCYKDENGSEMQIDTIVKFYSNGIEFNPNFPSTNPLLEMNGLVEARVILDPQGLVDYDPSDPSTFDINYTGTRMPYDVVKIEGEIDFNDELEGIIYAKNKYPLDIILTETVDGIKKSIIDKSEYEISVYSKENDVYIFGDNVKNKPYRLVGYDEVEVMFVDQDQEMMDIYIDVSVYGGYKFTINRNIEIKNKIVDVDDKTIKSCDIVVNPANHVIGKEYSLSEVIDRIDLVFTDNSVRTYESSIFDRIIDSGRIYFENLNGCYMINNRLVVTKENPTMDIRFRGWKDSGVIDSIRGVGLSFYPEIEYIGFKNSNFVSSSALKMDVNEEMFTVDGIDESLVLNMYIKGINLKYAMNDRFVSNHLMMNYSSCLTNNGSITSAHVWSSDIEEFSFDRTVFSTNENSVFQLGVLKLKDLKDSGGNVLDREDIGYMIEDRSQRLMYGYVDVIPEIAVVYGNGSSLEFSTGNVGSSVRICSNVNYHIVAQSSNENYGKAYGSGWYINGQDIVLTSEPIEGNTFRRWYLLGEPNGMVSDSSSLSLKVLHDDTYVAKFLPEDMSEYRLNVVSNNTSYGSVNGSGFYEEGERAEINVIPASRYYFESLEISDASAPSSTTTIYPTSNTVYVTMDSNKNVTANFRPYIYINAQSSDLTKGDVVGTGYYKYGATAILEAREYSDYSFEGWYEVLSSTTLSEKLSSEKQMAVTVTGQKTYYANFADYVDVPLSQIGFSHQDVNGTSEIDTQSVGDNISDVFKIGTMKSYPQTNQFRKTIFFFDLFDTSFDSVEIEVSLKYMSSCESYYEMFGIGVLDKSYGYTTYTEVRNSSGFAAKSTGITEWQGPLIFNIKGSGRHFIEIYYVTDGSVTTGEDCGKVYISSIRKRKI